MIRINLLGQVRPKATKQSVPLESTLQIFLRHRSSGYRTRGALRHLRFAKASARRYQQRASPPLRSEKANLQQIKHEVDHFEAQKAALQTQIGVIEDLAEEPHRRSGTAPDGRQHRRPR